MAATATATATIAHTPAGPDLGRIQGLMNVNVDHVVPPNSTVLDFKFCENCGRPFTRRRGYGIRYCGRCVSRSLMPPDQRERDDYHDQLPDENIAHLSYHLVKYDDSLLGNLNQARSHGHKIAQLAPAPLRHPRRVTGDWLSRLIDALARGPLPSVDIAAIMGGKYKFTSEAVAQARARGLRLEVVGCVWPRPSCMGSCPKLYALAAMVPDA